ncbi:Fic/DOC family protein [Mycobacteroides abscessus]|uniref:Fic/DOC family protein n=1 Tax=Mycobacteroides abscessus TaxID=36809 RepID=UPI000317434C|nr:Fic family protein [Mycobacteroides abscessus]
MAPITAWVDYFIPGTQVLANKLGLTDAATLQAAEDAIASTRITALLAEPGDAITLDYTGFQRIHRIIFGDVYSWAGQPRTTPLGQMTKEYRDVVNHSFDDTEAPLRKYPYYPGPYVDEAAHKQFSKLARENNLQGLNRGEFISRLAGHWAEINTIHSFREGNTRTQVVFFALLADAAGHRLRTLELLENEALHEEFIAARFYAQSTTNYEPLAQVLERII